MTTGPYRVEEVENAGEAACTCDNCGWTGTADKTVDVQSCALTPGDASPVGRCPECDGLAYLDKLMYGQATVDPHKVADAVFQACRRQVEKGRSLDNLNLDSIIQRAFAS